MGTFNVALFPSETVLFPGTLMPVRVSAGVHHAVVRHSLDHGEPFGVVLVEVGESGEAAVSRVGTLTVVRDHVRREGGTIEAIGEGSERFQIEAIVQDAPFMIARVSLVEDDPFDFGSPEAGRALEDLSQRFRRYASLALPLPHEIQLPPNVQSRLNLICSALLVPPRQKQMLLEETDVERRMHMASTILRREICELDSLRAAMRILRGEQDAAGPYPFSRN